MRSKFCVAILGALVALSVISCRYDSVPAPAPKTSSQVQKLGFALKNLNAIEHRESLIVTTPIPKPYLPGCDTCSRIFAIQMVANALFQNALYRFDYDTDKKWVGVTVITLDYPDTIKLITVSYDRGQISKINMYNDRTYTITYDENGRVSKATDDADMVVRNFTYNSYNQLTNFTTIYSGPNYPTPVTQNDDLSYPSTISPNPSLAYGFTAEYDASRNPVYELIPEAIQTLFSDNIFNSVYPIFSGNNLLVLNAGTAEYTWSFNYNYNGQGLPYSVVTGTANSLQQEFLFLYTN